MRQNLLSVVVPTYRQPKLLAEAVVSVLRQKPAEQIGIVLVNDGCPFRETDVFCRAVRRTHSDRVLYVHSDNRGGASARNAGIEASLSSWPNLRAIYFLDGDDRLFSGTLRRLHRALRDTGCACAFCDLICFGDESGLHGMAGDYSVLELFLMNYVSMGSLVSRSVFDYGVRFDESMRFGLEDWDFWLRNARAGFRSTYVPGAALQYRRRSESMSAHFKRSKDEALGRLYRNHCEWANPRNATEISETENPRFAYFSDTNDTVSLFTDPRLPGREMARTDFVSRLKWNGSRRWFRRLPAYVLAGSGGNIERLRAARVLNGLLWHMETLAAETGQPVVTYARNGRVLCIDTADSSKGSPALALISVAAMFQGALASKSELDLKPEFELGGGTILHGSGALNALEQLYMEACGPAERHLGHEFLSINRSWRWDDCVITNLNRFFGVRAIFPLTGDPDCKRIAVLYGGEWHGESGRHLTEIARQAVASGCSAHLFWLRKESDLNVPSEVPEAFATVTPVATGKLCTQSGTRVSEHLLGLCATSHIVLNHECRAVFAVHGQLKRWGARIMCSFSSSPDAELFRQAISHESGIDGYVSSSSVVSLKLRAHGVPDSKLIDQPSHIFAAR